MDFFYLFRFVVPTVTISHIKHAFALRSFQVEFQPLHHRSMYLTRCISNDVRVVYTGVNELHTYTILHIRTHLSFCVLCPLSFITNKNGCSSGGASTSNNHWSGSKQQMNLPFKELWIFWFLIFNVIHATKEWSCDFRRHAVYRALNIFGILLVNNPWWLSLPFKHIHTHSMIVFVMCEVLFEWRI